MQTFDLVQIKRCLSLPEVIDAMREALVAQARGECDTPMPMHLDIAAERAEVHVKCSYRRGGALFAWRL